MDHVREQAYDQGLRNFMTGVYNRMALALLVSAGTAYGAHLTGFANWLAHHGGYAILLLLVPFGLIFYMAKEAQNGRSDTMMLALLALAAVEGAVLSIIIDCFSGASLTMAFLSTAAAFCGLSLWGYTTKRNLSGLGSFFLVALIGLIVVMVLNIFIQSFAMAVAINVLGVLLFAGLIAYDTQNLKAAYGYQRGAEDMAKIQVWGALDLYLDFLNMFLFILQLFGASDD